MPMMELGAAKCLLLVAQLCFASASSVQFKDSGLTADAVLAVGRSTVYVELRTDNQQTPDQSRMASACVGTVCLYYFKTCATRAAGVSCRYEFSEPGATSSRVVQIDAGSRDDVSRTEAEIGVVLNPGAAPQVLWLSAFETVSSAATAPTCPRSKRSGRSERCGAK